ncbi:hypothetical protein BJV78DRAFT_172783 [Lactifluus subvellereus]|nr:hypothetical protein BJV78DRAFT_172783 [Lactifluus subvellereus]
MIHSSFPPPSPLLALSRSLSALVSVTAASSIDAFAMSPPSQSSFYVFACRPVRLGLVRTFLFYSLELTRALLVRTSTWRTAMVASKASTDTLSICNVEADEAPRTYVSAQSTPSVISNNSLLVCAKSQHLPPSLSRSSGDIHFQTPHCQLARGYPFSIIHSFHDWQFK